LQHRLKIEGRAADDLEHVGGGGLLLERFTQFLGACFHLIEQPHVLDCDDGLIGERRDEVDLLLTEWINQGSGQKHDTNRSAVAHEWNR